ncbi:MAG: MerR family transcriptional regulator [Telluria sp.]
MSNPVYSISEVERETGLAKETLRVWERRYAFPQPGRDANGERIYPRAQLDELLLIKRLMDNGYRPGKLMAMTAQQRRELAASVREAPSAPPANLDILNELVDLVRTHRIPELRQRLSHAIVQDGLRAFVHEVAAPLTRMMGDAWEAGTVAVFEEHLYSEALQSVLHNAIAVAQQEAAADDAGPCVLLTTLPFERHGLGLLMAQALLVLEGARCISLGVQTPLGEIVDAARSQQADVVALSFSAAATARATVDNVTELCRRLQGHAEVWTGGAASAAARRHLGAARVMDLDDIPAVVAVWRARHRQAG